MQISFSRFRTINSIPKVGIRNHPSAHANMHTSHTSRQSTLSMKKAQFFFWIIGNINRSQSSTSSSIRNIIIACLSHNRLLKYFRLSAIWVYFLGAKCMLICSNNSDSILKDNTWLTPCNSESILFLENFDLI